MNIVTYIFVNKFAALECMPKRLRNAIYRRFGINSKSMTFGPRCIFRGNKLSVGTGCYINENVYFECSDKVEIGNNVFVGMGCSFVTSSHKIGSSEKRAGENITKPIVIKDGTWIGCNCVILPGTVIEDGVVVGGGSVVHGVLLSNRVYAGNPIKEIREL